ncbi:hypothetical protein Tco_0245579 [Tanacetum coccineum]
MRLNPELEIIRCPSIIKITDTILEVLVPLPQTQVTGPVIDITPLEQPESPPVAPKVDRGKGKVTDDAESPKKLIKASNHLDKEENMKKATEEAKLLSMSKPELIKVVHEEASKARIDPKILESAKGGQEFKKIHDAEMKVLNREHSPKVKKVMKLRKKRLDQYMWTTTSRIKPEPITDVKIHPNTKPAVIIVYKGTNRRNFEVHNPFRFGDFRVTELDELGPIIWEKEEQNC